MCRNIAERSFKAVYIFLMGIVMLKAFLRFRTHIFRRLGLEKWPINLCAPLAKWLLQQCGTLPSFCCGFSFAFRRLSFGLILICERISEKLLRDEFQFCMCLIRLQFFAYTDAPEITFALADFCLNLNFQEMLTNGKM